METLLFLKIQRSRELLAEVPNGDVCIDTAKFNGRVVIFPICSHQFFCAKSALGYDSF